MLLTSVLGLAGNAVKPVVALTGAGGKSTLLFQLGAELAGSGRQVLLTTTTRFWARQVNQAPFSLISEDADLLLKELPISLRGYKQVLAVSGRMPDGKVRGLSPDALCRLAMLPDVEAVVVEADGSRERPLKAPAAHEPAVPPCATHVVSVASLAALGKPLNDDWVHRAGLASQLAELAMGQPLTPEAITRLLLHPQGGPKGRPEEAEGFLYLNLCQAPGVPAAEMAGRLEAARRIAQAALLSPPVQSGGISPEAFLQGPQRTTYRSVFMGSAGASSPVDEVYGRVAGIVLAAGSSRRFGSDHVKQTLPWAQSNTLVGHVVDTALAAKTLQQVTVVVGHEANKVGQAIGDRQVHVVINRDWDAGQSSSVQAGLRRAQASMPTLSAVVFLLSDQPDVSAKTIDSLVEAHRRTQAPIVAPVYRGGVRGNPVLFDHRVFDDLCALEGDVGGRPLLERYRDTVQYVIIDLPQPRGIETWEDYLGRQPGP